MSQANDQAHGICGKPYRARQLSADLIALEEALQALEKLDPRQARVVEMRFFAGLSQEEVAEALNVSVGTVRRDWSLAEAWLFRELNRKGPTK